MGRTMAVFGGLVVAIALAALLLRGEFEEDDEPRPEPAASAPGGMPVAFTAEQRELTRDIVERDPAVREFFEDHPYEVVNVGPWHRTARLTVVGGALRVRFREPVSGTFSLPGVTDYATQSSRTFQMPWRGVREATVLVRFRDERVAGVIAMGGGGE